MLHTDSDIIDVDEDIIFIPSQWIGTHMTFPGPKETPLYIAEAYEATFALPENFHNNLPAPTTPVTSFVNSSLPSQSQAPSFTKPQSWYTDNDPTTDLSILLSRPIPHPHLVQELVQVAGQAWFDGRRSIKDRRYNNGAELFPLSALTLWEKLQELRILQDQWSRSSSWISGLLSAKPRPLDHAVLKKSADILRLMPYNNSVRTRGVECTSREFSRLLGQGNREAWLNSDIMDLGVEALNRRLLAYPERAKRTCIANLLLMNDLRRAAKNGSLSKRACKLGDRINAGELKDIYLLTVVNEHWVVIHIDMDNTMIEYGECIKCIKARPSCLPFT